MYASSSDRDRIIRQLLEPQRLVQVLRHTFGGTLLPQLSWEAKQEFALTEQALPPQPDPLDVAAWLELRLDIDLEVPVTQSGGRLVGHIPLQVSWPDTMDGFADLQFPFNWVYIEVATSLRSDSDLLELIRRTKLYEELQRIQAERVRKRRRRYMIYTKDTPFKEILNHQGIAVYQSDCAYLEALLDGTR